MRCPECGAWVEEGRTLCGKCGAIVVGAASQPQHRQRVEFDMPKDRRSAARSSNKERQSMGRAFDDENRQAGSSERREDMPFKPAFQPEEPKRPKVGIIVAIVAVIAIVLIVLFVFPGFLKGCSTNGDGKTTTAAGSSAIEASSDTSTSTVKFDAEKAEAVARDAALDAGKQVFTGTVRATTMKDQAAAVSEELAADFASSDEKLVLLELEGAPSIEARSAGDMGLLVTRPDGQSLRLDDSYSTYDGKKITVAVHAADMMYPSDVAGALYTVTAENVAIIAPLTEKTAEAAIKAAGTVGKSTRDNIADIEATIAQQKAEEEIAHQAEIEAQWQAEQAAQQAAQQQQEQQYSAPNNYYIIPDSNSRYLSRSELEGYSTYDLYLARNEIYARNGRMFNNQDLRDYFGSQAWYNGSIAPESFDSNWMSDVERQNALLMRQIEQERNSPYL